MFKLHLALSITLKKDSNANEVMFTVVDSVLLLLYVRVNKVL